jgi:membrane-bound metal-dependent hydrolase YbcI (DUF457 family)
MPLPVAHGLLGASVVAAGYSQSTRRYFMPLLAGAFLANLADFDFILVFVFHSKSWHRGFSHSILFGLIVCLILVLAVGKRHLREAIAYGLAFTSHGILDYLTTREGGGVELLWPFSTERFVLGLVGLSEMPSTLTDLEILRTLGVELICFAPLLILVLGLKKWSERRISDSPANT